MARNYDPSTYLAWFRRLDRHPEPEVLSLAEAFCQEVASWLKIAVPKIYWYEPADFVQAKEAWLACPGASAHDPTADPLRQPCEFFRWHAQPGVLFAGYTHGQSPLGIMVNICRRDQGLLETITEECVHMYQDSSYGARWRAATDEDAVEKEAKEFVRSKAKEIRDFLDQWKLT
jgi:hypothetical protein